MKLSGREFAKTPTSVFTAEVVCPWCDRVASIDIGPQHRNGLVDYHCQKCSKFSSHTVKTADKFFDQHQEKLKKEKEVWKRIPPEAYVTCRRSATSGASFVYTLYTGKGSPTEYLSRDSVEHALVDEFGMSWHQANALLISAGLGSHGGQRVYLRQLTKISAALEERKIRAQSGGLKRGDIVKINEREALFLRHSSEGFAIVAFPGVGDAEVPVVDLEVIDAGDSPAEVGFGDFIPEEEMLEAETSDVEILHEVAEHLEEAVEKLHEFVGEEIEEHSEEHEHEEHEHEDEDIFEDEKEARRIALGPNPATNQSQNVVNQERYKSLYNIINDPNTDPATLQEAQRQLNMMKQIKPPTVALSKRAWWYKSPWEIEHMERVDQTSQAPRETPKAEESDLYPKVNDLYPKGISRSDKAEDSSNERGDVIANRDTQRKVHNAFNRSGDLKKAITFFRNDLSISDIRDLLRFYQASGKIASHEADDLARWFIGTKPRLLSAGKIGDPEHQIDPHNPVKCKECGAKIGKGRPHAEDCPKTAFALSIRQVRGTITGGPGSYHVKSEEGKNLGGPYKTRDQAKKRLQQVEYFKHKGEIVKTAECTCEGAYDRYCPEHGAQESRYPRTRASLSKKALLDKGMGIFQPALYRGNQVLVIAIDNTGSRATVEDGQQRQFQVDVSDLTPVKTGPYSGKNRG